MVSDQLDDVKIDFVEICVVFSQLFTWLFRKVPPILTSKVTHFQSEITLNINALRVLSAKKKKKNKKK